MIKEEILNEKMVKEQIELIAIFARNNQKAMDGKLTTDSDFFFALKECVLASLTFAVHIGEIKHTVLKAEDILVAITTKPSEPLVLEGHSRAYTFVLNIDLAKKYLFDALMVYERPSSIKKTLLTDKVVIENLNKGFKDIGKCFQLFGLLAKEYGRDTNKFFSDEDNPKESKKSKLFKLRIVPYSTDLQRKYNEIHYPMAEDIDLNCALFLVSLYKKLVKRGHFIELEKEINKVACYEFLNEDLKDIDTLASGEIYFDDGELNNEMIDFIHDELLENLEEFCFEDEMKTQILEWEKNGSLYHNIHNLVACSLSLVVI